MRSVMAALVAAIPAAALAQAGPTEPSIAVTGQATVETPPDLAVVSYDLTGEGRTPDEASRTLATQHKALVGAVLSLLGPDSDATSGGVQFRQTRGRDCAGGEDGPVQLSEGVCAVTGHVVSISGQVRTRAVAKAGTAVGLAGRLGARDARIDRFEVADAAAAQRRATAAALADARRRAEAAADGAGVRLGPILSISDPDAVTANDIVVTGERAPGFAPAPPAVEIAIRPRPIETSARISVRYAILR